MEQRKQTAVEWLMEEISYANRFGARFNSFDEMADISKYFDKAKQMEKEQIRDAWTDGCIGELYELNAYFSSGKYYNETYGKE